MGREGKQGEPMGIFQGIFQPRPVPYFIPLKTSSETDQPALSPLSRPLLEAIEFVMAFLLNFRTCEALVGISVASRVCNLQRQCVGIQKYKISFHSV